MNKNKGFTLIELLVVIAIIGILASVVLASLNSARAKGADAAIKSNLNNIRAQAELFYDSATPINSYDLLCENPNIVKGIAAAAKAAGVIWVADTDNYDGMLCEATPTTWIASVPLKSRNIFSGTSDIDYWCVDSTGNSKIEDEAPIQTVVACL